MCKHVSIYKKCTIFHVFWTKLYFQKPKIFTCDKCVVVKRSKEQIDKQTVAHERETYYTVKSVKSPVVTKPTLRSTKTSTQKSTDILARKLWRGTKYATICIKSKEASNNT